MITISDIVSGFSRSKINQAIQSLVSELNDKALRRDGLDPNEDNSMQVDLDMNSNAILNLPAPLDPTSPVRLKDLAASDTNTGSVVHLVDFLKDGVSTQDALSQACVAGTVVVFDELDITFTDDFVYPANGKCVKFIWRNTTINMTNSSRFLLGNTQKDFVIQGINAVYRGGVKKARLTADFVADGVNQTFQVEAGHDFVVGDQIASSYNNNYLPNSTSRLNNPPSRPLTDFPTVTATTDTTITVSLPGVVNEAMPAGQPVPIAGALLLNTRFDRTNIDFRGSGSFVMEGVDIIGCGNAFAVSVVDPNETCDVFLKNVSIINSSLDASKFRCNSLTTENFRIDDTLDIGKQGIVWANETKHGDWHSKNDTFTPNNNDALLYLAPDNGTTGYMPNLHLSGMHVDGANERPTTNNDLFSLILTDFLAIPSSVFDTIEAGTVYAENCVFKNIDRNLFGSTFSPVTNASYGDMTFVNCYSDADVFHERASNITQAPRITYSGGYMRVNIFTMCLGTNKIAFKNTLITEDFPLDAADYFTETSDTTTRVYKRGDYILNTTTGSKHKCLILSSNIGDSLSGGGYPLPSNRISKGIFSDGTTLLGDLDLNSSGVILQDVRLPNRLNETKPRFFDDYATDSSLILEGYTNTSATRPDLTEWFTKIDTDRPPVTFLFESTTIRGKFGGDGLSQNEYHLELLNLRNDPDLGSTAPLTVSGAFAYRPPVGTIVSAAKDRKQREVVFTQNFTLSSPVTAGDTTITGSASYQVAEGDWIGVNVAGSANVQYYEIGDISAAPTYGLRIAAGTDIAISDNLALIKHRLKNPDNKSLFVSDGDVLSAFKVNVLTDGGTYILPPADLIENKEYIQIELPEEFKAFTPTVAIQNTDTINFSGGTDTSIVFDTGNPTSIKLYSDGVQDWSL